MAPPDGGYWIQNGEHESARSKDGIWRASEIDTEHFTIERDSVASVYHKYFKGQVSHIASKPVGGLLSLLYVVNATKCIYLLGILPSPRNMPTTSLVIQKSVQFSCPSKQSKTTRERCTEHSSEHRRQQSTKSCQSHSWWNTWNQKTLLRYVVTTCVLNMICTLAVA